MSDAAKQYLINKEYEAAKSANLKGIVDRMEENARRLAIEKNPGYLNSMSISSPDASNRSHFYLKYWRPE